MAIGEHRCRPQRIAHGFKTGEEEEQLPATITKPRRTRRGRDGARVRVEGLDDVMVRLSRCCTHEIIVFVSGMAGPIARPRRGPSAHR